MQDETIKWMSSFRNMLQRHPCIITFISPLRYIRNTALLATSCARVYIFFYYGQQDSTEMFSIVFLTSCINRKIYAWGPSTYNWRLPRVCCQLLSHAPGKDSFLHGQFIKVLSRFSL